MWCPPTPWAWGKEVDVDELEDQTDGAWQSTGQTFIGKGNSGEDVVFTLQKRGKNFRIAPQGKSRGKLVEDKRGKVADDHDKGGYDKGGDNNGGE